MGPFSAVGKLSANGKSLNDVFDRLARVSKGAVGFFNELKSRRDENTNFATYDTRELPKSQRETISRYVKELKDEGLVRRARKVMVARDPGRPYVNRPGTFMINPELLKCWEYEDAALLWEVCKR